MAGLDVLGMARKFFSRDDADMAFKWRPKDLWNALREEPGRFRYAVWIKSAFLTSVVVLLYSYIRSMTVIHHLVNLYSENRERFTSHLDDFEEFLMKAGWSNGIDSIKDTIVVQLYLIVDAVVMDLKHTAPIGYLLGTLVGLQSLIAVLIQHKRLSLAISEGLRALRHERPSAENQTENPWTSFQQKYPILGACFFLAILCSTAVVQLHTVGILCAVFLGLVINFATSCAVMNMFGYFILVSLMAVLFEFVMMHYLKTKLISPDGALIRHPRWFNFFFIVLSIVGTIPLFEQTR